MSIGHIAFGSFPVLPSPDVLWKPSRSTKRPLGPNSPALLENLAQSVAKRMLFLFKISLSKSPAVSPGRHFPFLVNGKLTNVCTDYSRMDAKACTPQAKGAPVFPYHLTKGRGEDLAKVCAMLCSGKKPSFCGNWLSEASTGCERGCNVSLQHAGSEGLCWADGVEELGQPLSDTQTQSNQIPARLVYF